MFTTDLLRVFTICVVMSGVASLPLRSEKEKCTISSLARLTKVYVNRSLTYYVKYNGEDIKPLENNLTELQAPDTTIPNELLREKIKCSLEFMNTSLKAILNDQLEDSNEDLISKLKTSFDYGGRLLDCIQAQCPTTVKPTLSNNTFKNKQWSFSVLEESVKFLSWLECYYKNGWVQRAGEKEESVMVLRTKMTA